MAVLTDVITATGPVLVSDQYMTGILIQTNGLLLIIAELLGILILALALRVVWSIIEDWARLAR